MTTRDRIFKTIKKQNVSIASKNGYYTVLSACACKSGKCKNFVMSIYREDNILSSQMWITNDEELSMANYLFEKDMEPMGNLYSIF